MHGSKVKFFLKECNKTQILITIPHICVTQGRNVPSKITLNLLMPDVQTKAIFLNLYFRDHFIIADLRNVHKLQIFRRFVIN